MENNDRDKDTECFFSETLRKWENMKENSQYFWYFTISNRICSLKIILPKT